MVEWQAEKKKEGQTEERSRKLDVLIASLTAVQGLATRPIAEEEKAQVIEVSSELASWRTTEQARAISMS